MPAEYTIRSVSSAVPSANTILCAWVAPSTISFVLFEVCTQTPSASICLAQHPAGGVVELHGHEPRREFDHVCFEPKILERFRGFESQQSAADDRPDACAARGALITSRSSIER